MPTLRDVLDRLADRSEVESIFVLGRDGLLIDQAGADGADGEAVAAMAPNLLRNANELGSAAHRDEAGSAVIEYSNGVAVLTDISPEVILVAFVRSGVPFGALLYELRQNKDQLAALV